MRRGYAGQRVQQGVMAVEVGLVMVIFIMLLLCVTGLAQLMWTWIAATDATRIGARTAAVCDIGDRIVKARMQQRLPALRDEHIQVEYFKPGGSGTLPACVADDPLNACRNVRVTISGFVYTMPMLLASLPVPMPTLRITVPREVMQSAGNSVCRL